MGDELVECNQNCTDTFGDPERVFQSEFIMERKCKATCLLLDETCQTRAEAILIASILLMSGLLCATFLVFALESIMNRFGASAAVGGPQTSRAAYHEPTETEDEKRAKQNKGKKKNFKHFSTVEARCKSCEVVVDVDIKWMTCERGGMDPAVCPRCKQVVLGVL